MKIATILITGFAFVAVLAGFVVLTLAGKDTSVFVGFATSAAVFLIPQILNLLKAHSTASDVQEIKHATNGPLTKMQEQVDQIATQITKDGDNNAGSS